MERSLEKLSFAINLILLKKSMDKEMLKGISSKQQYYVHQVFQ